ncbi:MAG: DUF4139 domain-containing protein [Ignavibacteriae bacterium]|nr:DUF4139 domain-containing protein [Ignavibacteriota bacterium]
MKQLALLLSALTLASPLSTDAQEYNQKKLAVTVYNNNLGVVKDTRELNIKSGNSKISITDVAKLIDPTSVHIKLDGQVIEQNYQYDLVNLNKILQKYVDRDVQLFNENNELIEGKLLSAVSGQIVLQKKDGGLLMIPNLDKYRFSVGNLPDGLITKPTLVWSVNSNNSGKQNVEISYQTRGMGWHAEYVAVLNKDDTKLDLNSWVSVDNNSGATYKNAKLKLVAGDVNRVQDRNRLYKENMRQVKAVTAYDSSPQFEEKSFFEYHIYNLQRPTTLAQNETKQISLFEAQNVTAKKKYFFRSGGGYYGNNNSNGKVNVIVEFDNKESQKLGVPMPKGKVRMYKSDGESLEFVGEDFIDHTPRNETIKLKIGDAFDIIAEERQVEHKKITDRVYEQVQEIKIKNRKKEDVVVEVERHLGYNWEILNTTIDYKKKNATTIVFQVLIKENKETILNFKVRYVN